MRVGPLYSAFNAGEFSPRMAARVDFPKYTKGLEICENLIPLVEGGVMRRPGTRFIAEAKNHDKICVIRRFMFSVEQVYFIEMGHNYFRFYRDQGQIQSGGNPYEIASTYTEAQLKQIRQTQSADVLYLFHVEHPPRKLSRTGHTSWTLTDVDFIDGPYLDTNTTATTLTPSGTTGSVTVTASAVTGINGGQGFLDTDIGRHIRISNPASGKNWGWGKITARASTTSITVSVQRNFATTNASATWMLGAFSDTTGYPATGTFAEQRLVLGGARNSPQTIYFSQSGSFDEMAPDSPHPTSGTWDGTVEDDDAIVFTISSDEVNTIQWITGLRQVVIGTTSGEWTAAAEGAVITPKDISIKPQTKIGAAALPSAVVGGRTLFVQRATRKIIEFGYSFEDDAYRESDMTRLANHITESGVNEISYAQEPEKLLWFVRNDGALLSLTYNRAEDIIGWSRHITDGQFESLAVGPGSDGAGQIHDSTDRDEVWCVVKRTINGNVKRYIEMFERNYETGHDQADAYYADSLLTYDGVATTTITGLGHLEGKTVKVFADGAIQPSKTVSSGSITMDQEASVVQVGLPYKHRFKTWKHEGGAQAGTAVTKPKRIHSLVFILLNSHTIGYGSAGNNVDRMEFRRVGDSMDTAVPFFTGEWAVNFDGEWTNDSRIYIESNDPVPFTLLGIAAEMSLNERA